MDCLSSRGDLTLYHFAKREYEAMPEEVVKPQLLVTGADLIAAGYQPGPRFREMLSLAEDAQLEGRVRSKQEGLQLVREQFPL